MEKVQIEKKHLQEMVDFIMENCDSGEIKEDFSDLNKAIKAAKKLGITVEEQDEDD